MEYVVFVQAFTGLHQPRHKVMVHTHAFDCDAGWVLRDFLDASKQSGQGGQLYLKYQWHTS